MGKAIPCPLCHCERSEAISQLRRGLLRCLQRLAMTGSSYYSVVFAVYSQACPKCGESNLPYVVATCMLSAVRRLFCRGLLRPLQYSQ